jgi:hypothetical protein
MNFAEVLEELPALSIEQRQILIRRAVEVDEPPLDEVDNALVSSRLEAHRRDPESSVPLDKFKSRVIHAAKHDRCRKKRI